MTISINCVTAALAPFIPGPLNPIPTGLLSEWRDYERMLAKASASTPLTEPGRIVGTLAYLAPELFRGEPASPRSDIYSFGCLVYEGLTSRAPFAGRSLLEVGVAHLDEEPEDPHVVRADVSPELSWTVLRALAKDPVDRPPTATAYATMLRVAARARA